jgi:hypothetical protein
VPAGGLGIPLGFFKKMEKEGNIPDINIKG